MMVANKDGKRKTVFEKKKGDTKINETKVLSSPI